MATEDVAATEERSGVCAVVVAVFVCGGGTGAGAGAGVGWGVLLPEAMLVPHSPSIKVKTLLADLAHMGPPVTVSYIVIPAGGSGRAPAGKAV